MFNAREWKMALAEYELWWCYTTRLTPNLWKISECIKSWRFLYGVTYYFLYNGFPLVFFRWGTQNQWTLWSKTPANSNWSEFKSQPLAYQAPTSCFCWVCEHSCAIAAVSGFNFKLLCISVVSLNEVDVNTVNETCYSQHHN